MNVLTKYKKTCIVLVALCLLFYSMICLYLYYVQDNMIFFPQPVYENELVLLKDRYKNVEDVKIKSVDGVELSGWYVDNSKAEKSPLVIYFGGNAEEVSHLIGEQEQFNGWSMVLMNYRGYGNSQGQPSEKALFSDALQIYDYFLKRKGIDPDRIVVMGRSIGSGVAVYTAANRKVKGIILATPYDSFVNLAQKKMPFFPAGLILKHKFDSLSRAPYIKQPVLELVAEQDEIIPPAHAKLLSEKWGGDVKYVLIKGEDHNSISLNPQYWEEIKIFLNRM